MSQVQVDLTAYISDTVTQLEKLITKETPVNALNILSICIQAMKIAEGFLPLKGEQKKEVVLQALVKFMQSRGGDVSILSVIPSFIDQAISIDKGTVKINVTPEDVVVCCGGILSGCMKK